MMSEAPAMNGSADPPRPSGVRVITRESVQRGEVYELPPTITARVNLPERWRNTGSRFGDLSASQLTGILRKLDRGDVWDWADLCEFWLASDPDLASLYGTRLDRICDRDWEVIPNEFGDQRLANDAAELCHELLARIENWHKALRAIAHAVAVGFSAGEREWDYDRSTKLFYVRNIHHRHGHRFRYGPAWNLRLYDRGQRPGHGDGWGEVLDPRLWIVHQHQEVAGYPTVGGVMRASAIPTLFGRWVEKMAIGGVEKWAQPVPVLLIGADTPRETRDQMLSDLQSMSGDGVFVTEKPNELQLVSVSGGGSGSSAYKETLDRYYQQRARLWLGSSDVADPGEHGTQGAVGTRVDATTDPKTVSDCKGIAQTLHLSLLKDFVFFNAKRLGAAASQIPVPKLKAWKTEEDVQAQQQPQPGAPYQPGMLPNGMPAPRIPEIQLARDHDPKAAASGEPRRARRVVGQAARLPPTRSTSLETQIARVLRGG